MIHIIQAIIIFAVMKKPAIDIHRDELKEVRVKVWQVNEPVKGRAEQAHRDDHFIFIIQRKGDFLWELDFNQVTLTGPTVCYVAPGQVHRYINIRRADVWMVFMESDLVPPQAIEIFNACLNGKQTAVIADNDPIFQLVPILDKALKQENTNLQQKLIGTLAATLALMTATKLITDHYDETLLSSQQYQLVTHFKKLLSDNFREIKQVKIYSVMLNITPLYLNEVSKAVTGFTASYWINQQVLLEAKRLLYYTTLDVKQVAYELGYDDHTYFSRFFKKHTGLTALSFRTGKP
jgi:AraC family transcriptional activator of pobA